MGLGQCEETHLSKEGIGPPNLIGLTAPQARTLLLLAQQRA